MNGIIVINKEPGYTSRDIVNIVGKALNTKKIGHTGTLDPIASGVLVLCIGSALKLSQFLVSNTKEYIVTASLGYETDMLDTTGKTLYTCQKKSLKSISKEKIETTLSKYKGKIKQEVPLYSAVKIKGKKLYEYARNGKYIDPPVREIEIKEIELLEYNNNNSFKFRCVVSKGTYIRSLVRDIGRDLGVFATMSNLIRTRQGIYKIDKAYSLNDIKCGKYTLLDPTLGIDMPKVTVNKETESKIKHGQILKRFFPSDMAMVMNKDNILIAIYKTYDKDKNLVKPYKVFE